jgi:RNase P/RNase MRP subunit POP5
LRVTVEDSKKSGTMRNIEETFREASDTYRTVKEEMDEAKK